MSRTSKTLKGYNDCCCLLSSLHYYYNKCSKDITTVAVCCLVCTITIINYANSQAETALRVFKFIFHFISNIFINISHKKTEIKSRKQFNILETFTFCCCCFRYAKIVVFIREICISTTGSTTCHLISPNTSSNLSRNEY